MCFINNKSKYATHSIVVLSTTGMTQKGKKKQSKMSKKSKGTVSSNIRIKYLLNEEIIRCLQKSVTEFKIVVDPR